MMWYRKSWQNVLCLHGAFGMGMDYPVLIWPNVNSVKPRGTSNMLIVDPC